MADEHPTGTCTHCGKPVNRPQVNRFCSHRCVALHLRLAPPSSSRPIGERFWKKVDKTSTPDGCWEWIGSRTRKGYGRVGFGRDGTRTTHRVSWELAFGEIPPGMLVCHHCDNPPCVRPDHLFLGTNHDNVKDSVAKGRFNATPNVGNSRLTADDVRAIRSAYPATPAEEIARRYGVSTGHIQAVIARRFWKSVA